MKLFNVVKISLFLAFLIALSSAYVKAYTIAGPSMAPTYWYGDFVVSNHAAYDLRAPFTDLVLAKTGKPQRADLIMYYDIPKGVIAAKRIVGIPGDVVSMTDNVLYLNGIEVKQTSNASQLFDHIPAENDLGALVMTEKMGNCDYLITYTPKVGRKVNIESVKIPNNKHFILGDNRDNSADSRFIGLISRSQIKGKVIWGNRSSKSYSRPSP